jgi:TolB-like protein
MSLIAELKRRKVFKVGAAYLVVAWLAVQAASIGFPAFDAPPWALRIFILVALLGFPIAVVMAWVFDATPEGVKLDATMTGSKRVFAAAAILIVLALGWYFKGQPAFRKGDLAPTPVATTVATAVGPRSIAVLPFVNMSADKENEFFSDGLSEEILNSLARIDGMQVVGRTSSFQFKGKNEDLRSIGEKLGVATVLEGSVRREGERARITAQLIRTADGIHLWSQTYDRTLQDTLAVQLDIAEQVAGALNVVLDDKQHAHMREDGVENVDAFIAYQKGMKLYDDAHDTTHSRDVIDGLRLANAEFAKATTLEPGFAQAYFASADLYDHILLADDRPRAERLDAQREAMRFYGLTAQNSHDAQQRLLALVERQLVSDDWHGLAGQIDAALTQPGCRNPDWLPVFASAFGYADRIENLGRRTSVCDPLNRINFNSRTRAALAAGRAQQALEIIAASERARGGVPVHGLRRVQALLMLGRLVDAKAELADIDALDESRYTAEVFVGAATGEDPIRLHARLKSIDRGKSIFHLWDEADAIEAALSGNSAEADRRAAALDARPAGPFLLAVLTADCLCGAPFDLAATPNFKARLAESGLTWPPAAAITFPARAQEHRP